jgi:hypothetical protein
MAKLIYERDIDEFYTEASKIEFTVSEDMNIYEFHTMCIRLASAIGYQPVSINRAFGKEFDYPESDINDMFDFG